MRRIVLLLLILGLTGCVGLRNKPVTSVRAEVEPVAACPGQEIDLLISVQLEDGRTLRPVGQGGNLGWKSLDVKVEGPATLKARGKLAVSSDPREGWGRWIRYGVSLPDHFGLIAGGKVGLRYDCPQVASVGGAWGRDGEEGDDGSDGDDGHDAEGTGQGEDGQAGRHGGHGGNGQHGGLGPTVFVRVAFANDPVRGSPVLQVEVTPAGDAPRWFAVDGHRGELTVDASGGMGGHGGPGGEGGDGGDGGEGSPSGRPGKGGQGGDGGVGGDGGAGGSIRMVVDPRASMYVDRILLVNHGGVGGRPGDAGEAGEGGFGAADGADGHEGEWGHDGQTGPAVEVLFETVAPMWGELAP